MAATDKQAKTRKQQLAAAKQSLMVDLGKSGVVVLNGIISMEEYNSDLQGLKGLKIWNKMRKSDATVRASLKAIKLPIRSANWYVDAGGDTPGDEEAQRVVEHSLFEQINFDRFLREGMTSFDFGFSLFEQQYMVVDIEGKEYIGLKKMAFMKQDTIRKWEAKDGEPGVTQQIRTGENIPIEDWKLTRFTFEQEGDNYEGESILRPAYRHWYTKDKLYQIDAIAQEKQGLGTLKIKAPAGAKDDQKEAAKEVAREQRANEENYIEEPEGFEIEFMDMKAKTTREIMPSILHHDRQIFVNVMAQFLTIGSQESSGSFSASQDQSPLFIMALQTAAKEIAEVINATVVRNIVDANGIKVTKYPEVKFNRIGQESISVFSTALKNMVDAGLITPDEEIEAYLRDVMHLPDMAEELVEYYQAKMKLKLENPLPVAPPAGGTGTPAPKKDDDNSDPDSKDTKVDPKAAADLIDDAKKLRDSIEARLKASEK